MVPFSIVKLVNLNGARVFEWKNLFSLSYVQRMDSWMYILLGFPGLDDNMFLKPI